MALNAHALLIGVAGYRHIRSLPPVADTEDLAAILRDPEAGDYDPAHVAVLQDASATRAAILDGIDQLAGRAGPGASALLYFSGHGGRAGDGSSYLMAHDSRWGSSDELAATAIPSELLRARLAAVRADQVTVILDCCHASSLAQAKDLHAPGRELGDLDRAALGALGGPGRAIMAASRGGGSAYVVAGARHGLFTGHLLAGLRGAAAGSDGMVRVLDLYHHVQRNVVARMPDQRPFLKAELEDNYPIARCRRGPALTAVAPPSRFAYDVFVTFASDERDAAWARLFVRLLEDRGVRVCTEERDAELGGDRLRQVEQLIESSRYTMPILTPRFTGDTFRRLHDVMAQHLGIEDGIARLIPLVREPCEARLGLRALVHLDMIRDEHVVPGIERLVRTLRRAAAPAAR